MESLGEMITRLRRNVASFLSCKRAAIGSMKVSVILVLIRHSSNRTRIAPHISVKGTCSKEPLALKKKPQMFLERYGSNDQKQEQSFRKLGIQ